MDLLPLALVLAMAVVAARWFRGFVEARRRRRLRQTTPGLSQARPLRVASFKDVDRRCDGFVCPGCDGRLVLRGETRRGSVLVSRTRCVACDDDVDLFFELPPLLH
jgi:hypothetical protein